ncbi:glycoside hydrolase family 32 protein [Oerskovia flava]|uniref:glycoside hydrolase family 32 protein n=1 Tax=Oerskovia flava TaxID=2986422 RepID=UPI00223FDD8F|nr:glycoside hydrolase family 32 protein [Oerskovia sp. JB1-3-2]
MRTAPRVPRPAFHFAPQRHWMNDPNGLVVHRGLWHLYFQHNPEGSHWGNMSWGHATSTDLEHWTEHPVALPYLPGEQIYSGSVVAPRPGDEDLLTAYYTSAYDDDHQAQSRATSRDGGFTWELDPDNPVLDRGTSAFRDPKVVRVTDDAGGVRWIMLCVEADDRQVLFYASDDLRSWEHLSTFGPLGDEHVVWECPDLIPLAVDGDPHDVRWVLTLSTNPVGDHADPEGSSMSYVVGHFDGVRFTADEPRLVRLDHGRDFYAGVTFDGAPGGAAIMLGWMSNWRYADTFPSAPWRGAMSLPRRLSLRTIEGAPRLVQEPPGFVRAHLARATRTTVLGAAQPRDVALSDHALVELRWDPASTGALRLGLQGEGDARVDVEHTPGSGTLRITRSGSAAESVHPDFPWSSTVALDAAAPARLLLSLDGPLLEVFVNDGESTVSNLVVLGSGSTTMTLDTERHSPVTLTAVDVPVPDGAGAPVLADRADALA